MRPLEPASVSAHFDGLVCDLDGVIYRGDQVLPGAPEAIRRLRARGVRVVFCTNNSRYTVDEYVHKLNSFGVTVNRDDIISSGIVTAEELIRRGFVGASAMVVGGHGIEKALIQAGIDVGVEDRASWDIVVVGWDRSFDYTAMARAATAVRAGALFIATNSDATFPAPRGLWPGAGAVLASIEVASGRKAEVMGKPRAPMMNAVARRLRGARSIAVVGDRPDSDLEGGRARGWHTILVLSGVTGPDEAGALDPQPDLTTASLADLG